MRQFPIPTALTLSEMLLLQRLAWDRVVFEAGALLGYSTVTLSHVARHVTSVDPHRNYPVAGASTYAPFKHNLNTFGKAERVSVIVAPFQSVTMEGAQLAFADLTGDGELAREFLHRTREASVPVVALHDYERAGCVGATQVIDEYIRRWPNVRVTRRDTLIVLEH